MFAMIVQPFMFGTGSSSVFAAGEKEQRRGTRNLRHPPQNNSRTGAASTSGTRRPPGNVNCVAGDSPNA